MNNYERRLERLENAIAPQAPRFVLMWEGQDKEAAIAAFRAENNWPDDGLHPVRVIQIVWQAAKHGRPA